MRNSRSRLLVLSSFLVLLLAACSAPGIRFATNSETARATTGKAAASATTTVPVPAPTATTVPPITGNIPGSGALAQFQDTLRQIAGLAQTEVVQVNTGSGLGSGIVPDAA